MIYEAAGYLAWTLTAGFRLLIFSVFLSLSVMVVKSAVSREGWGDGAKKPDSSDTEKYEPLRKDGG